MLVRPPWSRSLALAWALGLILPARLLGQGGAPFPEGYPDPASLGPALKRLAESSPRTVRVESLGKSLQGRDLWLATISHPGPAVTPPRPAILVVANLEADHVVGSLVALGIASRLAAADGRDPVVSGLLDRCTIYLVPCSNPDGAERNGRRPREAARANLRALDRDRDGRLAEDGPEDLDGDGLITTMRVFDGRATHLAGEADPRLSRRADPAKGERARFREFTEGIDDDGDDRVNEDPAGGVDLNRNWPHKWSEFDPRAGTAPASEPEVLALIRFGFDHPEVAILWNFGLNDNLHAPEIAVEDADKGVFAEFSRLAKAASESAKPAPPAVAPTIVSAPANGRTAALSRPEGRLDRRPAANEGDEGQAPPLDTSADGSVSQWAYHQLGIVGIASRLWSSPEFPAPAPGQAAPPAGGEARWLAWNDRLMGGRAFVPFAPFEHPTLGRLEIGGWKPGVRINPPAEHLETLIDEQFAMLKAFAARLPSLAIVEAKAESRGKGLFEVTAWVENAGPLPTALAQGVRTRKAPPVLVRLVPGKARLLAGQALTRIETLGGSGGRRRLRWLVQAPAGTKSILLEASCPKAGGASQVIPLP